MKFKHENLGTINQNKVVIETDKGTLTLFFSYETIVGFIANVHKGEYLNLVCRNEWGRTTGKILNWLEEDKEKRVNSDFLNAELKRIIPFLFFSERELLSKKLQTEEPVLKN